MIEKPQKGNEIMSDKPREWPYKAKEARDRSAELAQKIVNTLQPLLDGVPMSDAERMRREAVALASAITVCRYLEGQGAQTRPE